MHIIQLVPHFFTNSSLCCVRKLASNNSWKGIIRPCKIGNTFISCPRCRKMISNKSYMSKDCNWHAEKGEGGHNPPRVQCRNTESPPSKLQTEKIILKITYARFEPGVFGSKAPRLNHCAITSPRNSHVESRIMFNCVFIIRVSPLSPSLTFTRNHFQILSFRK